MYTKTCLPANERVRTANLHELQITRFPAAANKLDHSYIFSHSSSITLFLMAEKNPCNRCQYQQFWRIRYYGFSCACEAFLFFSNTIENHIIE
jgi:hypothetical protein